MFPQEFINEVKERVDLVELVSEYTELRKSGTKLYSGRCPHPKHDDHDPSFRVWQRGYHGQKYDSWSCMVCHAGTKNLKSTTGQNFGSDCIAFYQWMENVSWKKAVYELCEKYSIPIPSSLYDKLYKIKVLQTDSYIKNLYSVPLQYLYDRGLTDKEIKDWKIGFQGDKIVFPLMNRYRAPIGFTKRWIQVPEGCKDKYKNSATSKIFNKSSYFYGSHNIIEDCDELRITEGPMDVIIAHKYGLKNVVATLGTAFTDEHVEVIKSLDKIPVFVMDGDPRGIIAAEKAITKLANAGIYSKILILPGNKDLCDMSNEIQEDIEDYVSMNAITYGQYKMNNIVNAFDSKINELKLKQFKEIKKILEEIPYEAERMIMKEYILKRMDIRL